MKHERNVDGLRKNAQRKRQEAIERTEQGIKQLLKEGKPINFKTVAEASKVSPAWLYREPEIKARIEQLRTQGAREKLAAPKQRASDASKDAIIRTHKDRIRRLEAEIQGLRKHIEVISGLNIQLESENESLKKQLSVLRSSELLTQAPRPLSTSIVRVFNTTLSEDMRSELDALGVEINSTLLKMIRQVDQEAVWLTIEALKEQKAIRPVSNPTGFMVEGLKSYGWQPNQQYQEALERDTFKEWFDLAYLLKLVTASQRNEDGVQYVYTSDDECIPFDQIRTQYPLEDLRKMLQS